MRSVQLTKASDVQHTNVSKRVLKRKALVDLADNMVKKFGVKSFCQSISSGTSLFWFQGHSVQNKQQQKRRHLISVTCLVMLLKCYTISKCFSFPVIVNVDWRKTNSLLILWLLYNFKNIFCFASLVDYCKQYSRHLHVWVHLKFYTIVCYL